MLVTEGRPDGAGACVAAALAELGVPCTVVLDAAVASAMERADLVLVGAEGVVENGGVINKVGTLTVATCARAMRKPLYVAASVQETPRKPRGFRTLEASISIGFQSIRLLLGPLIISAQVLEIWTQRLLASARTKSC